LSPIIDVNKDIKRVTTTNTNETAEVNRSWGIRHWFVSPSEMSQPKKKKKKLGREVEVEEGYKDKISDPLYFHYGINIEPTRSQKEFLDYFNSKRLADHLYHPKLADYEKYMYSYKTVGDEQSKIKID
jgi:hypothetical protein